MRDIYTLKHLASHWKDAHGGEYKIAPTSSGQLTIELANQIGQDILELYDRLERLEAIVFPKKELICEEWKPKS